MNQTAINNLLRVLEAREADGSASVTCQNKSKAIKALIKAIKAKEAGETPNPQQAHCSYLQALRMSNPDGTKIITDTDREAIITEHLAVLSGTWDDASSQIGAITEALELSDSTTYFPIANPASTAVIVKTVSGTKREDLKTLLSTLIETL